MTSLAATDLKLMNMLNWCRTDRNIENVFIGLV